MERAAAIIKYFVTAFCAAVWFSIPAGAQEADLDALFAELQAATPETHATIAADINLALQKSGSAAMDLLYRRGVDALEAGEYDAAAEHFSAAIDHAPDFAEAFHGRASAFFNLGLTGPALDDLRMVLVLQPRHFEAMFGIGQILETLDRPAQALEVYEAVLTIYPLEEKSLAAIERLALELDGQAI